MRNLTVNLAIAVTISGFFAVMLSAQAAKGAAQLQSETTYTIAADPYLPIQVIEPAIPEGGGHLWGVPVPGMSRIRDLG